MKKSVVITLMSLILWVGGLQAAMIIVAADGSGDVTTIQAGINMAAVVIRYLSLQVFGRVLWSSITNL